MRVSLLQAEDRPVVEGERGRCSNNLSGSACRGFPACLVFHRRQHIDISHHFPRLTQFCRQEEELYALFFELPLPVVVVPPVRNSIPPLHHPIICVSSEFPTPPYSTLICTRHSALCVYRALDPYNNNHDALTLYI